MSQIEDFNPDRDENETKNIDAFGKKWGIGKERFGSMLLAVPEPNIGDRTAIPKQLQGKWTGRAILEEAIRTYVKSTWDMADQARVKNERKANVQKEQGKSA